VLISLIHVFFVKLIDMEATAHVLLESSMTISIHIVKLVKINV
jgi:hypothetical protein